jgi:cell division septation protein DedD
VATPAAPEPRVAAVDPIRTSPRAERPQAQAPPAIPRTLTTKAYWLKISTVRMAEAGRLVSRLRDDKHHVALERTRVSGKPMVQISVGPFKDASEAVSKLLDLQTKGHDPVLVAERH